MQRTALLTQLSMSMAKTDKEKRKLERKRLREEDVPFFPDWAMFEMLIAGIVVVFLIAVAIFWPGVAGPPADPDGSFAPESFLWWSISSLPEWVVAIGMGAAIGFVLLLFFIPRLDPKPGRSTLVKRVLITSTVLFMLIWGGIYAAYGLFAIPHGTNNTAGGEATWCWRCHSYSQSGLHPYAPDVRGDVPDENCMQCHLDHPKLVSFYLHEDGLFRSSHNCSDCHNPHAPVANEVTPGENRLERMRNGGDTYVFPYTPPNGETHAGLPMNTCAACHEFDIKTGGAEEVVSWTSSNNSPIILVGEHPPLGERECTQCHLDATDESVGDPRCLFSLADGDVHGLYDVEAQSCAACHDVSVPDEGR